MAGRRLQGGAAGLIGNLYLQDRKQSLDRQDEERKFRQRLQALGIAGEIKAGRMGYDPNTGTFPQRTPASMGAQVSQSPLLQGDVTRHTLPMATLDRGRPPAGGFVSQSTPPSQAPAGDTGMDLSTLPPDVSLTHTIKTPQGTITIRRSGQNAKAPPLLSQQDTGRLLQNAVPGTPLPRQRMNESTGEVFNNVPLSPAGVNTMNAAIRGGITESPSVQSPASFATSLSPGHSPQRRTAMGGLSFTGFPGLSEFSQATGAVRDARTVAPIGTPPVGNIVMKGGRRWRVVGHDQDGEPLVEPAQ